jgi:hypothetical protein
MSSVRAKHSVVILGSRFGAIPGIHRAARGLMNGSPGSPRARRPEDDGVGF